MSKAAELAALIANVNNGSSLGNKNLVINGAMNVAQRGTSGAGLGASAGYFTVDRWDMYFTGTAGRLTQAQIADGPSGFANCMKLSCTTADTSIAAGENVILQQHIEGQNCQALCKGTADAKPITVSFWVKGNASATYTCGLWDNDNSRQNNQTFAVTTSWNRIELTFPADTTGALDDDTANSLGFYIYLQAGSTYTGGTFTSGTWASVTNANTVKSDQTQFFDSTSRTFFITGVQMEIGEKATEFEHEPFSTTLSKCERYFKTSYEYGTYAGDVLSPTGSGSTSTAGCLNMTTAGNINRAFGSIQFSVKMRDAPTMVFYAPESGTNDKARDITSDVDIGIDPQDNCTIGEGGGGVQSTGTINAVTDTLGYHYTATSEL
jgi:hypothetical protein